MLELQTLNIEYVTKLKAAQSGLKESDVFQPSSCLPFGSTTGIYRIKLSGMDTVYVPCDDDFYRNWSDYRLGALKGEFFLGLEKLHRLTARQRYELYVHLEDLEGNIRYAHYDTFSIGSEQTS
ncbi:GH23026 [Drosophila grimshawi]|uniref:GH23026 n=1 Tax=Drosophila grimshawi TaxID=7222 RepID=B4JWF0_DROGR|nr:GH23026 [Drosophila grimshawi]